MSGHEDQQRPSGGPLRDGGPPARGDVLEQGSRRAPISWPRLPGIAVAVAAAGLAAGLAAGYAVGSLRAAKPAAPVLSRAAGRAAPSAAAGGPALTQAGPQCSAQIGCPQPLPVRFVLGYTQHGRPAAAALPGFPDLGKVRYSNCS